MQQVCQPYHFSHRFNVISRHSYTDRKLSLLPRSIFLHIDYSLFPSNSAIDHGLGLITRDL